MKTHLHAGSGYVAKLNGDAEAFQDHRDSVLRVLDLGEKKYQTFIRYEVKENFQFI